MSSRQRQKLIDILSDGEFHSGEEIGEKLGLTRAAVWKQLKCLDDLGLNVISRKGLGYRFDQPLNLLSVDKVLGGLDKNSGSLVTSLDLSFEQSSTNQVLIERASQGIDIHRQLVVTERQTLGRGRRGRSWYSPFAKNLYFSLGWRTVNGVSAIEGLSLAVGLAVCRALAEYGVKELSLKWPNDILLSGRKLGGVLIELSGDMSGDCSAVIGVGLNVMMPSYKDGSCANEDLQSERAQMSQPWASLVEQIKRPDRNSVLVSVVRHLLLILEDFESLTFSSYREEWENLHFFQNREVELLSSQNRVMGVAVGVDDSGALKLDQCGTINSFCGGEVSLRAVS